MKIFISWSGELSHKVACGLRDWLPSVIQSIRPYVSSEDIDKGTRWSTDIAQELEEASYGIICVTKANVNAPWINFESGALSKSMDKANVSPFLFRIKRSEVQGPLLQFQSTVYDKDDVAKLMSSINTRLREEDRLSEGKLHKAFEVWWPELKGILDSLKDPGESEKSSSRDDSKKQSAILEELLELARAQQRLLRSPEDLLPLSYIKYVMGDTKTGMNDDTVRLLARGLDILHQRIMKVEHLVRKASVEAPDDLVLADVLAQFHSLHDDMHLLMDLNPSFRKRIRPPPRKDPSK